MRIRKKKKLSIAQLRKQNAKLSNEQERRREIKELEQENYRLKHPGAVRFVKEVSAKGKTMGKYAGKLGMYVVRKAIMHKRPRGGIRHATRKAPVRRKVRYVTRKAPIRKKITSVIQPMTTEDLTNLI